MTTPKINQKEYLKKYLSSNVGDEKKKKKKKSKSKAKATVKIIDDDIDLAKLDTNDDDLDIFNTGEDAPQIVGVIDDRPPELQALDYQNSNKWKAVNNDNAIAVLQSGIPKSKIACDSPPRKNKKKKDLKRSPTHSKFDRDDLSPQRRRGRSGSLDLASRRKARRDKNYEDGDLSPKRTKSSKYNDEDRSPKRNKSTKYTAADEDLSPHRRRNDNSSPMRYTKKADDDLSPKRYKSDREHNVDYSPKRHRNRKQREDLSPKRYRSQTDSDDSEQSPNRYKTNRNKNEDLSPKRLRHRKHSEDSDCDLSPKRTKTKRNEKEDISPNQHKTRKHSEDLSPKRYRSRKDSDGDLSPKRYKNRNYSPKRNKTSRYDSSRSRYEPSSSSSRHRQSRSASFDISPPRKLGNKSPEQYKNRRENRNSPFRQQKIKQENESPPPTHSKMMTKTLDGKTAGLSDAKSLCIENAKFKEREQKLFEKMTDEMSGRHAEVVMRDRSTGKRRNFTEESEKQRKKEEKEKAKKAIYDRWGAGLKQVEAHKTRLDEISHEMNKPLARYSNDNDLDVFLKKQERDGDPMLEYIRQKEREKNKQQGIPELPKYDGSFPDNRFNIRPGYRWDGVDRSNGFEKKWFESISKKKAVEEEAYRYSTEDM